MSFVLPLLMQDNWEEIEGLSHTSEDCASSSSQCSELIPSGILLLNLYSNGKLNPFLKEAGKKKKYQSLLDFWWAAFPGIWPQYSRDELLLHVLDVLQQFIFFSPQGLKHPWGLVGGCPWHTEPAQPKPNPSHTSIIEEHSTMVNLSSLMSCSFCRGWGGKKPTITKLYLILHHSSKMYDLSWATTWLWQK